MEKHVVKVKTTNKEQINFVHFLKLWRSWGIFSGYPTQKCIADPNQKEISNKPKLESLYGITDLYLSKFSYFKRQKATEDSPAIWSSKHVYALSSGSVYEPLISQFFMLGLCPLAIANAWLSAERTHHFSIMQFLTMPCPPQPEVPFPHYLIIILNGKSVFTFVKSVCFIQAAST